MPHHHRYLIAAALLALAAPRAGLAQGTPVLRWSNLDGAAPAPSTGGVYRLSGTLGQPDAIAATGGTYRLTGGFWVIGAGGAVDAPPPALPTEFALLAPSPNPFDDGTTLALALPEAAPVRIEVFGLAGERVRTVRDGVEPAGVRRLAWDGRDALGRVAPAGIYFVRVWAGGHSAAQRLVKLH